jgi:hypothetical protein
VLQVRRDLTAVTDATHGGDQAYGLIGLDHGYSLRPVEPPPRTGRSSGAAPLVLPGGVASCL